MDVFNKAYVLSILESIESEINKIVSMTNSFSLQQETDELKKHLKDYIELVENSINKEEKEFDLLLPSIQSFYLSSNAKPFKQNDTKKTRFHNKLQPNAVSFKRSEDNNILTPFKRSEDNVLTPFKRSEENVLTPFKRSEENVLTPFKRLEEDIPKKVHSDTAQKKQCVEEHNVTRDFIDGLENLLESLKKKYY